MTFCTFATKETKEYTSNKMHKKHPPESSFIIEALFAIIDICATTEWTMQFLVHTLLLQFLNNSINLYIQFIALCYKSFELGIYFCDVDDLTGVFLLDV